MEGVAGVGVESGLIMVYHALKKFLLV